MTGAELMPRKLEFKRDLHQAQISSDAREFLLLKKNHSTEPIYRVLDRVLGEYKLKEISTVSDERDKWKLIADAYYKRAVQAEERISELEQVRFI